MSKKFRIHMSRSITNEVTIEAASIDEAVSIAFNKHRKHDPGELTMAVEWADEEDYASSVGELCYEVVGLCHKCGRGIVNSKDETRPWHPEWKWSYDYVGRDYESLICYECGESPLVQLADLTTEQ